jgi:hypothetical protein
LPRLIYFADTFIVAWKRGIAIISAGAVKVTPDPRIRLANGYSLEIREAVPQDAGDYIVSYNCADLVFRRFLIFTHYSAKLQLSNREKLRTPLKFLVSFLCTWIVETMNSLCFTRIPCVYWMKIVCMMMISFTEITICRHIFFSSMRYRARRVQHRK